MYNSSFICSFIFCCFVITCVNGQTTDNSYTKEEKEAIQKLHKLTGTVQPEYLNQNFMLLKFLRDKNMNVNEAHENLKKAVEWRMLNHIDKIHDEKVLPDYFPIRVEGHDKSGLPIVYISPGRWDVRRLILQGQRDQLIRLWSKFLDSAMYSILETRNSTGKDIRDVVIIMDIHGYNLRQHGCLSCVSTFYELIRIYERNYPQTFGRFYIINAPRIFSPLVELSRGVFSPHTQKVLKVLGPNKNEWKNELLTVIDENELLKFYGGKKNDKILT